MMPKEPSGAKVGQRIDLEEVRPAAAVQAEVGAGEVVALERLERAPAERHEIGLERGVESAGRDVAPASGRRRVALDGVGADAGRGLERPLERGQRPGRSVAHQRDGVLGSLEERLDQGRLGVRRDDAGDLAHQGLPALDPRARPDPLGGPLPPRLDEERERRRKVGAGRLVRRAEAHVRRGTGTPAAATTRCAQSLSSVVDRVRASDPRVGTPAISHSTGTHASRFRGP